MVTFKLGDLVAFTDGYGNSQKALIVSPTSDHFSLVSIDSGRRFGEARYATNLWELSEDQLLHYLNADGGHINTVAKVSRYCLWNWDEDHGINVSACTRIEKFSTIEAIPYYCPGCGKPVELESPFNELGGYDVPKAVAFEDAQDSDYVYTPGTDEIYAAVNFTPRILEDYYHRGFMFKSEPQAEMFRDSFNQFLKEHYEAMWDKY